MIPSQRHRFVLPDDVAYLNCSYLSPQLRSVTEAGRKGMRSKEQPWTVTADDFFDSGDVVRERFATLIGADAQGVALIPAASYGISVAAANLEILPGQTIVVLREQFPSNVYPWWHAASIAGAELVTVPRPSGPWTPAVLEAIDKRTAVVAVPHCHWTDGSLLDLAAIGAAVRGCGGALVVDTSQSTGAFPLEMDLVKPDFLITVGYKWLLGPYRSAYLWAAPLRREGVPIEHSWMARRGSRDFSQLVDYTSEFQPGARRYDGGEFGDFVSMPMLEAALDQVLAWGVDEISATLGTMTGKIEVGAAALGLIPAPARERVPHMIGVRFPAGMPDGLQDALVMARVYVSVRGDSVRMSPHLFTTDGDIDRLLEVFAAFT